MGVPLLYSGFETCFSPSTFKIHLKSRFGTIWKKGEQCYKVWFTVPLLDVDIAGVPVERHAHRTCELVHHDRFGPAWHPRTTKAHLKEGRRQNVPALGRDIFLDRIRVRVRVRVDHLKDYERVCVRARGQKERERARTHTWTQTQRDRERRRERHMERGTALTLTSCPSVLPCSTA